MEGRAEAPGAGTVLNALATHTGSAFAIDRTVTATVELDDTGTVEGHIGSVPDVDGEPTDPDVDGRTPDPDNGERTPDTGLIERCVELAVEHHGAGQGGVVRTDSEIPVASGLKSSSAAANAAVLATMDALDVDPDPLAACRLGVEAARDVGVTVTGAFDDASASMLGGVTVTDNDEDALLDRGELDLDVLVWTPPRRAYSADADVERCRRVAPAAELAAELALEGRYGTAMTINGLAFGAALGQDPDPLLAAMPVADGVSLSGTGPSVLAIGDADALQPVRERWDQRAGTTWLTTTRTEGARTT